MSITASSPALVLLFVGILLWMTMDVHFENLSRVQKWLIPLLFLLIMIFNHLLRFYIGSPMFDRIIPFCMHIPIFFIFMYITKCGIIRMSFMIFTALIFTAPTIIFSNSVRQAFPHLISVCFWVELLSFSLTLVIVHFVFRDGFIFLLRYGDDRSFLLFSIIPFLYYIYIIAGIRADFSSLTNFSGHLVRYTPSIQIFCFYFLLLRIYKELSRKKTMENLQYTLAQNLDSAKEQIRFLQEAQDQAAIYRHDIRHHMTALSGLLSTGRSEQAKEYIKDVLGYTASLTTKRFCENDLLNLLCASYYTKTLQAGITFNVKAALPNDIPIPDTELCAVLSNGLENALEAVMSLEEEHKWIDLHCDIKFNKLLIKIKNPYSGKIVMRSGMPVSHRKGHGVGCRSIHTIADHYHGLCSFETEDNIFIMQLMLPLPPQTD